MCEAEENEHEAAAEALGVDIAAVMVRQMERTADRQRFGGRRDVHAITLQTS
jgi:hypothetical protein